MKTLEDYQCWAVQITHSDGEKVLAVGVESKTSLPWTKGMANKCADRYAAESGLPRQRYRAIRVRVVITGPVKAEKRR